MEKLFEPGGSGAHGQGHLGKRRTKASYTEAQRLSAALNAEKAEVLHGDSVDINITTSSLHTAEGEVFLLPVAFTEAVKNGRISRAGASPRTVLDPLPGPLEEAAQSWEGSTDPIYWIHVSEDSGVTTAYPVYGYGSDYGKGYHITPMLPHAHTQHSDIAHVVGKHSLQCDHLPGWDTAEWLCRCSQCGRELPPKYFFINTSGHLKGICRACVSTNQIVDRIFHKGLRYRTDEEEQLLVNTAHWYEGLWRRNLCPRGDYAAFILGEEAIQARMNAAIRHRRGSAPRRPQATNHLKIVAINHLIDETSGDVYNL